ncbi:tetratricopeptide repeat protein [Algoriphagus terrigena]|uniref:tetratricopeptide repeat protein n=1 Tax=Algoriphagus terrigena TaxID=344884 RepID=UPI0003FA20AF|nr:tetratricopeptide repeat protein [Algoriphagus terrigena]
MRIPSFLLLISLSFSCNSKKGIEDHSDELTLIDSTFTTPLGKTFEIPAPSEKLLAQYEEAKATYEANPEDVETLIWYGRRTAYLGQYRQAIDIYSEGIRRFPDEPRLYRHRGHRYISIRKYDEAISDLEKAAQLIEGTSNEVEPDGMPNAQNIPVSSLHGNIWYHLGLAYYLTHQDDKAYTAYLRCRESGNHYDNIVSSTHWLYMIQRRLGNPAKADSLLEPIHADSTVIENQSYADLCRLYKGWLPVDSLIQTGPGSPSNDAVRYGVANWHLYHGDTVQAKQMMEALVEEKAFTSFGYLAAESDLIRFFGKK